MELQPRLVLPVPEGLVDSRDPPRCSHPVVPLRQLAGSPALVMRRTVSAEPQQLLQGAALGGMMRILYPWLGLYLRDRCCVSGWRPDGCRLTNLRGWSVQKPMRRSTMVGRRPQIDERSFFSRAEVPN